MKRCLAPLVIRDIHIKTTERWLNQKVIVSEDVEKLEPHVLLVGM